MVERIPEPDYREPVIVMAVRELIKDLRDDMNKRLDGIETKLDDRVTVGVFHALRSDLDAALRRIIDTEADIAKLEETGRAVALAKDVARRDSLERDGTTRKRSGGAPSGSRGGTPKPCARLGYPGKHGGCRMVDRGHPERVRNPLPDAPWLTFPSTESC